MEVYSLHLFPFCVLSLNSRLLVSLHLEMATHLMFFSSAANRTSGKIQINLLWKSVIWLRVGDDKRRSTISLQSAVFHCQMCPLLATLTPEIGDPSDFSVVSSLILSLNEKHVCKHSLRRWAMTSAIRLLSSVALHPAYQALSTDMAKQEKQLQTTSNNLRTCEAHPHNDVELLNELNPGGSRVRRWQRCHRRNSPLFFRL